MKLILKSRRNNDTIKQMKGDEVDDWESRSRRQNTFTGGVKKVTIVFNPYFSAMG